MWYIIVEVPEVIGVTPVIIQSLWMTMTTSIETSLVTTGIPHDFGNLHLMRIEWMDTHGIPYIMCVYIYIPGTQMTLGFKVLTHKIEGLTIQKRGHLGSRYIYTYI